MIDDVALALADVVEVVALVDVVEVDAAFAICGDVDFFFFLVGCFAVDVFLLRLFFLGGSHLSSSLFT